MKKTVNIAIDGPAGAGKSTVARRVAAALGYLYVDTGALYRTVGLNALRLGLAPGNPDEVVPTLKAAELQKEIDRMAREIRLLDNTLQETNWTRDLIEES